MTDQQFLTEDQIATLRAQCRDLNDADFGQYLEVVQRRRLDPFARQIYYTKRGGRLQVESTIDGFRVIADRTGDYAGQVGPFWCGTDGKWVDVWLDKKPPAAAKVGVLRNGFKEPLFAVANWDGYSQTNSPMWKKMGPLMLAKCAEALALRKAYPQDLSGLYTSDEMSQAGKDAPSTPEKPREAAKPVKAPEPEPEPEKPAEPAPEAQETQPAPEPPAKAPEPAQPPTVEVVEDPTDAQRAEFKRLAKKIGLTNKDGSAAAFISKHCGKEPADLDKADVDKLIAAAKKEAGE